MHSSFLTSLALLSLASSRASATLVNFTIDDSHPDQFGNAVSYAPADAWIQGNAACTQCQGGVDAARAFDGTWHERVYTVDEVATFTVSFVGGCLPL